MPSSLLLAMLCHVWLCHAFPPACSDTDLALASAASRTPDHCSAGGECDCSRIGDKNSEAWVALLPGEDEMGWEVLSLTGRNRYFQCVTNPNCERCWVSRTATTTAAPTRAGAHVVTTRRGGASAS